MGFWHARVRNALLPLPSPDYQQKGCTSALVAAVTSGEFYALEFLKRGLFLFIGLLTVLR